MWYLIASCFSFVSGCLAAGYFFHLHQKGNEQRFMEQEKELQSRKDALQELIYRTHHHGINPISKRIRGACAVIRLTPSKEEQSYWLTVIENEALTMETDVLNNIKEFEHLQ